MRILALDHGTKRIGIAISDELKMIAQPMEFVLAEPFTDFVKRLKEIIREKEVELILIGMPRNMDGSYGPAAEKVRAFAEKLKAACPCGVKLWDERLTSVAAQRSLHEAGRTIKNSRNVIDQVAAQMILQGWLDSQAMLG